MQPRSREDPIATHAPGNHDHHARLHHERRAELVLDYRRTFGHDPEVIASAPGRVNLIGEHTDYNGGEVLPIAIQHRTWVAVGRAPAGADESRAISHNVSEQGAWSATEPTPAGQWWDYLSGISRALIREGVPLSAHHVAVASDVPAGAGLSSSAALEVAGALAFLELAGAKRSPREIARLAHHVETDYVGVASGIMDQFASALAHEGQALHVWCDTEKTEHVPFPSAVLVFDTGVPRSLRSSEFNRRREECERALELLRRGDPSLRTLAAAEPEQVLEAALPSPLDRRALHVSHETRRVGLMVGSLLETGAIPGELLYESQESLRTLYECSSAELDWFVEQASLVPGVEGARLTGAGWGGCAIAVGAREPLDELARRVVTPYRRAFGFEPRTWITHAESGARVEPMER